MVDASEHPVDEVTIGIVGKYIDHQDAYKSLAEALKHGGLRQRTKVKLKWLESSEVENDGAGALDGVDGILVPGGFGDRGFEGKVLTAQYARETGIPYFGICYGMQAAVVDYARHVAGLAGANSTENDKASPHPVIGLITEWRTASGEVERRNEDSDLGGTMRLGLQDQRLKPGTLARELYGKDVVGERHRHRYEFNNRYRTQLEDAGLVSAPSRWTTCWSRWSSCRSRSTRGSSPARRTRNSCRRHATAIRCSSGSSAPRASTRRRPVVDCSKEATA